MIIGPRFVFQEKHKKEFLCLYELALFKVKAKDKAHVLCFLFLKVSGLFWSLFGSLHSGIQKTALEPSKNLVSTDYIKKIILDVVGGHIQIEKAKAPSPNSHNYLHLKADQEMGLGL